MNGTIYRENKIEPGGLPLPRRNLRVAAIGVGGVAVLGLVMPLFVFGAIGQANQLGGPLQGIFLMLGLALTGVFGIGLTRGRKVSPFALFAIAALPLAVALLSAWWNALPRVEYGASLLNYDDRARALARDLAESMNNDVFGGLITGAIALVVVLACTSSVATIAAGTARSGAGAIVVAVAWSGATLAISAIRSTAGTAQLCMVPMVIILARGAVQASVRAHVLRGWTEKEEAKQHVAALYVALVAGLLAVFAVQRALDMSLISRALNVVSDPSLDGFTREVVLERAIEDGRYATLSYVIHGVFGTLVFAQAIVPVRAWRGTGVLLVAAAMMGGAFVVDHQRMERIVTFGAERTAFRHALDGSVVDLVALDDRAPAPTPTCEQAPTEETREMVADPGVPIEVIRQIAVHRAGALDLCVVRVTLKTLRPVYDEGALGPYIAFVDKLDEATVFFHREADPAWPGIHFQRTDDANKLVHELRRSDSETWTMDHRRSHEPDGRPFPLVDLD